jgi:hypothetical protein
MNETKVSSLEIAVLLAKQTALIRVISVCTASLFGCFLAIAILVLYLNKIIFISSLEYALQWGSLLGLSPLVVALLFWRVFEKIILLYVATYARKYVIR